MAYPNSLIYWKDAVTGEEGRLIFESVVTEEHDVDNVITEFPVETGFIVSDHVIRKPRTLKMEVMSTNMVFRERRESSNSDAINKVKADFDTVVALVQQGIVVQVTTILGVYLDCVITKFNTKQDVHTASVMMGTLIIKELNVVGIENAEASKQALLDMAGTTEEAGVVDYVDDWGTMGGVA